MFSSYTINFETTPRHGFTKLKSKECTFMLLSIAYCYRELCMSCFIRGLNFGLRNPTKTTATNPALLIL